jgi:hypothetical protein
MKIDDLEKAESIVKTNPKLSWEGWNIVWSEENPDGYINPNGAFINSRWHIKRVFPLQEGCWDLPNKVIKG